MKSGFRLEGQIGNTRDSRTSKNLLEYTAGDIQNPGVGWITNSSPNVDTLTVKGGMFDLSFNHEGKKTFSIAVTRNEMGIAPYKEKQYIETFNIFWIEAGKTADEFWRRITFHHATVKRVELIDKDMKSNGDSIAIANVQAFYNVVIKVDADVEYKDLSGIDTK